MVCISGKNVDSVTQAKKRYDAICDQARKEHVYIKIPGSAVNMFVGKSGRAMILLKFTGSQLNALKKQYQN